MLLKDLRKAIWEGKLVDITGVKLRSWGTDHQLPAVLHISFDMPSVENKPVCDNLDIAEVSLSTKPKYDPCRLFRKGDKAKPRIINGRENAKIPLGVILTVTGDEDEYGVVPVEYVSPALGLPTSATVLTVWLELITPVEELEPYFIEESHDGATIVLTVRCIPNGEGIAFRYCPGWGGNVFHSEEQFRQHAVAECDRLNAEHRKEMGK